MGLDKVTNPIQAKDANLHQKKGIDILEMKWSDVFEDSRNNMIDYEVLKGLRPYHKLKILEILFYKGMQFPSWVGDPSFDQLTELTLRGCRSRNLPTLGHLQSLRKLFVERMNEVQTVGFDLLAATNSLSDIAFPSLEVLEFDDMQGWQTWSTSGTDNNKTARSFPRLLEISIKRCPQLAEVSVGMIPSLRFLHIDECSEVVLRSMIGLSSSLVKLEMLNVKGLTQLHGEDLMHLGALEYLYFDECDELRYLWELESDACKIIVSLKTLVVHYCRTLESCNCPNSVERLEINSCHSLTSLVFSTVHEASSSLIDNIEPIQERGFGYLPPLRLRYLDIHNCKNLNSFPQECLQSLTCLEELRIYGCPSIDYSFPSGLWPPNLSSLAIGDLNKPMSEWGPQNFPISLVELHLHGYNSGVASFAVGEDVRNIKTPSFLLPPSLVSLILFDFMDVESLSEVVQQLPCLKSLKIFSCPKLSDVHEIASYRSSLTVSVIP